jgi:CBS domain-containing protein
LQSWTARLTEARVREEGEAVRQILDIPVGDLMSAPPVTVRLDTRIEELTRLFTEHGYNGLPVVSDVGALQGLVTRLDLFKLYLLPYRKFIPALEDTWVSSVAAIMSPAVVTLRRVEPAIAAMALMVDYRIRTIPVVDDTVAGRTVVGVVTRRDLAAALKG